MMAMYRRYVPGAVVCMIIVVVSVTGVVVGLTVVVGASVVGAEVVVVSIQTGQHLPATLTFDEPY